MAIEIEITEKGPNQGFVFKATNTSNGNSNSIIVYSSMLKSQILAKFKKKVKADNDKVVEAQGKITALANKMGSLSASDLGL